MKTRRVLTVVLSLCLMILAAGCSNSATQAQTTSVEPVRVGRVREEDSELLQFEEPNPQAFQVAIFPNADNNIYQITMEYSLDGMWEGQQTMITEDGSYFDRQNAIIKTFSTEDLEEEDPVPPFSISLMFTDKAGNSTAATNVYRIEAPERQGEYILQINGDWDQGYELTDGML